MTVPDDLSEQIEENRITYSTERSGISLSGGPFICEFSHEVDPHKFCKTICTPEPPWEMFGATLKMKQGYFTVAGCLYHIDDGEINGSSKITLEVCSDWVRVYVKEGCSIDRVTKFVEVLDDVFGVSVSMGSDYISEC